MQYLERASILLNLLTELSKNGSWCGETHLHKCTLFLQELLKVPLGYEFIFYKYGPYSFELSDEVSRLRGDELVAVAPTPPYGVRIQPGTNAGLVFEKFHSTSELYRDQINFVASKVGPKSVSELEKIATALWVSLHAEPNQTITGEHITNLKPHVKSEEANKALDELKEIMRECPAPKKRAKHAKEK
jgi:uncharacterized protein YwgA